MNAGVRRRKLYIGFIYGLMAGLAFAIAAWGVDAWLLARANGTFFWIKFIPGLILCTLSGGLVGWLTIRYEKHSISILLWGLLAIFYAYLVVWLPFKGSQSIMTRLSPNLVQFFDFTKLSDMAQFIIVSLAIIGFAAIISGLLEINLVSQASLSSYGSASFTAVAVCMILLAVAGSATDQMINTNLREPIQVFDKLIQYAADHQNVEVPRQEARKMHLSAVNQLGNVIQLHRKFTLIGYDKGLGFIDILVDFEGTMAKCSSIYAQPSNCIILTQNR